MNHGSLRRVLGLQWALYTAIVLIGAAVVGVVALFVLEDSFIDERLIAAEYALSGKPASDPALDVRRLADLPPERHAELAALRPGAMREFRIDAGHYVHLRALLPDAQGPRFLVYEAQEALRVGAALRRGAPILLALAALLVVLAAWMAQRFVIRVERAALSLLPAPGQYHDGQSLREAAAVQPIREFREIGLSLADALQQRLEALQREASLLRFLAHELRTPLQSAQLALAGLPEATAELPQRARLKRALQRLQRAAAAVLWLGEATPATELLEVAPIARELLDELRPLAERRGQQLSITEAGALTWPLPVAAVESVLGNLWLNAIQHGTAGTVTLRVADDGLELTNPCEAMTDDGGFGLGLELTGRLLGRIGWGLTLQVEGGKARAVVSRVPVQSGPASAQAR